MKEELLQHHARLERSAHARRIRHPYAFFFAAFIFAHRSPKILSDRRPEVIRVATRPLTTHDLR